MTRLVDQHILREFLRRLRGTVPGSGRLYLVGETTQVYEGWTTWCEQIEFAAEISFQDRPVFEAAVRETAADLAVETIEESPADVIPLPENYRERARAVGDDLGTGGLQVYHFDPYSVAFRFIARGSEPDYHLVLNYLHHGWIRLDELERLLEGLLPRFTSETIQQDPAEFKRKYRGLMQMRRSVRPGTTHRHTEA